MTDDARNALLVVLGEEFRKGNIYERPIPDTHKDVWEAFVNHTTGTIVIDPTQWFTETLIHELLHRRYPRWSEKRVSVTASRVMHGMSREERRSWYRAYQRTVKRSPKPVEDDE